MSYCSKCGTPIEPNERFCRGCGAPLAAEAPAAPAYQPDYNDYSYNQPAYSYEQPQVSGGTKAGGFVGMGLGIGGFFFALLGFIYTIIGLEIDEVMSFSMAFAFSIFSLPLSIIGMSLSSKSRNAGNTSAVCTVGKVFGIIGLVLTCVMLFVGFVALADTW